MQNSKKATFHETFSSKLKISKGVALFTQLLLTNNILKNRKKYKICHDLSKFKIFLEKSNISPKTEEKFSKLKEKSQNSRENIWEDLSSPKGC